MTEAIALQPHEMFERCGIDMSAEGARGMWIMVPLSDGPHESGDPMVLVRVCWLRTHMSPEEVESRLDHYWPQANLHAVPEEVESRLRLNQPGAHREFTPPVPTGRVD